VASFYCDSPANSALVSTLSPLQSIFLGNFALYNISLGSQAEFGASAGPIYINESVYIFAPGDSIVLQYIELSADGSTPTGRRAFSQNITLVKNETEPITMTLNLGEQRPGGAQETMSETRSVLTTTRPPPSSTFPWTAQVSPITTTTGAGTSESSSAGASGAAATTPANAGDKSRTVSKFWQ
jgi:hypothetical protein